MMKNMFSGLTAWFSESVSDDAQKLWVEHGGIKKSVDEAQFLFSEDASCPDTMSVFESESYLNEHLSVFHASYILECVRTGNSKDVCLGKYFFPPAKVLKMMGLKAWQNCSNPVLEDSKIKK